MPSGSPGAPGDRFSRVRDGLSAVALHGREWCGLPVPIPGERLVVEKTHPAYKTYAEIDAKSLPADDTADCEIINTWYSHAKRCDVVMWKEPDGERKWGLIRGIHHLLQDFSTMGCSVAWSLESEATAMDKLSELLAPHIFKMYVLTGMFPETSKRSGVSYLFRRLKPTVALRPDTDGDAMKILCTLCLHPIAYYAETWAGAMCPTDDVIAHLMLMRADEKMFWRRANQIPAHRPEAGL